MSSIYRINNCIIEQRNSVVLWIGKIKLYEKTNKTQLDLSSVPHISIGNCNEDADLLSRVCTGEIKFNTLQSMYSS